MEGTEKQGAEELTTKKSTLAIRHKRNRHSQKRPQRYRKLKSRYKLRVTKQVQEQVEQAQAVVTPQEPQQQETAEEAPAMSKGRTVQSATSNEVQYWSIRT